MILKYAFKMKILHVLVYIMAKMFALKSDKQKCKWEV